MSNTVVDWRGRIVGFRCSECDQVKTKMWGTVCNSCRTLEEQVAQLKRIADAMEAK
jgi:hypothetical protein